MINTINMRGWLDRDEAIARLRVRPQTLYAYVSRGRIGMRAADDDPRRSLYREADIDALISRRARGRRASAVAASTIAWGEPSMPTSISGVIDQRLRYRHHDATALAKRATLEEIAALLWRANEPSVFPALRTRAAAGRRTALSTLGALAAEAPTTIGRARHLLCDDASVAVATLASTFGAHADAIPMHRRLARAWSLGRAGTDALRRALVLIADHELNASTFAARVAASTGAPIAASTLAGLATLTGARHGGAADAVRLLLHDAERLGSELAVDQWRRHDRPLPGFGHPLYPDGDPRAAALLSVVKLDGVLKRLSRSVSTSTGALPNVDFALVALARAYALPTDAPFRVFAIGRSVGWAAHAMEQIETGQLIRPRARFTPSET